MKHFAAGCVTLGLVGLGALSAPAQQCTTQSQMRPADKAALLQSAMEIASEVQANNSSAVRQGTVPEVAQDFSGLANTIASVAPHLQGATFQPGTLWILDARQNAAGADGKSGPAQFFCNLNGGSQSVTFSFQALPAGRYGMAVLDAPKAQPPSAMAILMREDAGTWRLAGFFPRPTTAAGHDGIWYWRTARADAARKQSWNAWLEFGEAERLLRPANFISSSHLEQLQEEQGKAAPASLSGGISGATPLIVKAKDGTEFRITGLGPDDSLSNDRIDVAMHYTATPIADPVAARARNQRAARALVEAYPELRTAFHGVWVYAESAEGTPFASEEPMASLP